MQNFFYVKCQAKSNFPKDVEKRIYRLCTTMPLLTISSLQINIDAFANLLILICTVYHSVITKTRLFKYIENFTAKKNPESFQIRILIFFIFLLKT